MFARSILAITALITVAPLAAQNAVATDAAHQAADAQEVPQTQSLNNQVGNAITQTQTANAVAAAQNDMNQEQYAADKAAYEQALRDHHREVLSTDATFIRQQQAYAMAMRDWRAQVAECKKGYQAACKLPAPDPMKYM